SAGGDDETAPALRQGADAGQHVLGVGAGDDQVVRVVGDRGAQGARAAQAEAADQAPADVPRGPVPLQTGDQGHVAPGVESPTAALPADRLGFGAGDDLVRDDADDGADVRAQGQLEGRGLDGRHPDGVGGVEALAGDVGQVAAVPGHDPAVL